MMSVLHAHNTSAAEVAYGTNWRFWSYDFGSGEAAMVETFDWNAGAAYSVEAGGKQYLLVPRGDYASTAVYELGAEGPGAAVLSTGGWTTRLFAVR